MPLIYILYILAGCICFGCCFKPRFPKKIAFLFLLILNICIVGLRSEYVGADSLQYYLAFKELNRASLEAAFQTRYAPGYIALNRLVGFFTDSPYALFFVMGLFSLSVYFYFLKKNSANIFFAIVIFFCSGWELYIVAMRQSMALACILLGLPFLFKEKKIIFLLFVFLATQFHASAIIAAFFVFLYNLKITKKLIIICIVCAALLSVFNFLLGKIVVFVNIGSYANYLDSEFNSAGSSYLVDFCIKVFPALFIFLIGAKAKFQMTKEDNFFVVLALFYLCIRIIALNSIIIDRLSLYFSFSTPILASFLFDSNRIVQSSRRLLISFSLFFFVTLFCAVQITRPNWMKISPYSPFWKPYNAYYLDMSTYFWEL